MEKKVYKYAVVGAGIAGCSVVYELTKRLDDEILLIDKLSNIAQGASGAAGAFLSPLLGKPNSLKELVTTSLKYTSKLYKQSFSNVISNCGTTRIPKNDEDALKFESYKPYIDFPFKEDGKGFFFSVGTVVNSFGICKMMTNSFSFLKKNLVTKFNYSVEDIRFDEDKNLWIINQDIEVENLILTTGASVDFVNESYFKIHPVWGRRLDVETTTKLEHNYHKACSVSQSFPVGEEKYRVSIGATHHRCLDDMEDKEKDFDDLLQKTEDIVHLEDIKIVKEYLGARACSKDYFPVVGELVNSTKTLQEFPHLKNGSHVKPELFTYHKNLYVLNGVGGRGFVFSPYLAKLLVDNILKGVALPQEIRSDRLFIRDAKRKRN